MIYLSRSGLGHIAVAEGPLTLKTQEAFENLAPIFRMMIMIIFSNSWPLQWVFHKFTGRVVMHGCAGCARTRE